VCSMARSLARLLKGRRRTDAQVASEYDAGRWTRLESDRPWTRAATPGEYLTPNDGRICTAMFDGRLYRTTVADYLDWRIRRMRQIVDGYAVPGTPLVELGCGLGWNLVALRANGREDAMLGLDISERAIDAARATVAHFGLLDIRFDRLDFRDASAPAWSGCTGATVFTHFALEQVPNDTERVLRALQAAGPARVIHIEPSTELLNWTTGADIATGLYVRSQDYQRRLVATAERLERAGALRIVAAGRVRYAPTPQNFPLVLVWEPRRP